MVGASAAYVAIGSIGVEGNIQRLIIEAAREASLPQLVRLSVLNASPTSIGINQRAHASADFAAAVAHIPYTTIRPAIFSASLFAGAHEISSTDHWTGLADTGRVGLVDHRDVASVSVRVLTDQALWGRHYELTGPRLWSWPEALEVLSTELGRRIEFVRMPEWDLFQRLQAAGLPVGEIELLIAREWAIRAGENERLTGTVEEITGVAPRTLEQFARDYADRFSRLPRNPGD